MKNILTAAAAGIALIATPVLAGESSSQSMSINYRDLNLSTPEGQEKLDQRIDIAARQLCQMSDTATGTRIQSSSKKACYENARKSVKSQIATLVAENQRGG
jgi:UrcA family protein